MTTIAAVLRAGQIVSKARIHGAGNVRGSVLFLAPVLVRQIVTAIDHDPRRVIEVSRERIGRDERAVCHMVSLTPMSNGATARSACSVARGTPYSIRPRSFPDLHTSMTTSAILIALGVVAGVSYALRRLVGSRPPDRGIDVGVVSTNWLSERRKDSPAE
jgi:hypothetical protein